MDCGAKRTATKMDGKTRHEAAVEQCAAVVGSSSTACRGEGHSLIFKHIVVERSPARHPVCGVSGLASPGRILVVLGEGREKLIQSIAQHLHCNSVGAEPNHPADTTSRLINNDATNEAVFLVGKHGGNSEAYMGQILQHDRLTSSSAHPICEYTPSGHYDVFPSFSTAKETMEDAAVLCRLSPYSDSQLKGPCVMTVLEDMSLGDCYWKFPNSLYTSSLPFRSKDVGRANDVLSASESRRLSVATQLVSARPKVLLLSEVTEGLPPADADYLLKSLRSHVETYLHTVVISMPEYPSALSAGNGSSTLTPKNLDALVLGAGGRSVYFGPIEDLTSHFSSIGYSPCSEEDNLCICCRALDPFAAALKLISVDEAAAIKSAEALELSKESIPRTPPNALVPSGRKLKKCNSKMRELPIPRSCQTSHTGMEHPVHLISLLAAGLPLSSHEADSEGVSHRVLGSETESIFGSPIGCTSDQSGKTSQTQAAISEYTISPTATAIMSSPEQSSQKYAERSSSACGVRARNINSSDPLQLRKAAHKGSTRSQVSSPSGRMKSKSMSPSVAGTPGSGGYPFSEFLSSSAFSSESASSDMPEKENSSPNSPGSSSLRYFQQAEDFGGFCFPAGTQTPSTDRSRSTASVANCSSGFFTGNTSQGSSSSSHSPASSARPGGRNAATAASETFTSKAAYDHIDDNAKSAALFDGVIPKGTVGNGCFPELASNMMNGGKAKNPTAHSIDRRPFARAEITWVLTQRAMRAATRDFSGLPILFLTLLYYLLVYGNTPKDDSPAWLWMTTMSVLLPGYGLVCGIQGIKMWCENHRIASIENQKGYYSMYAWVIAQVVCQLFCRMGCSFLSAIAFPSICQLAAAHSTNWGAETLQMAFLDALTVSMYGLFMWSCGCVCATTTQTAYQAGILLVAVSYLVLFPAFFAIISLGDDS